ncbi:Pectinesterase [Quillaja saponaria]|uniref:Pectinesterase n=1 Tax=Quillaja saponaria TaxID=32244 RepID=A0AAD7LAY3_QUISA|nr:Pectinesterase [Quillaja saponaria]
MDIHNFKPNVIVAADGSGSYTKIMDAVAKAPQRSNNRHVIYIKKGLYNEYVQIKKEYWNIVMVGDGIGQTIIAGDHSYSSGYSTMQSATVRAGEQGQQAVALRSSADQSIFYLCEMKGYQDTLYPQRNRQFYRECRISGTIDFIFGDGTVVFQKCEILARQRHQGKENTITAQKREEPNGVSGYSFHLCTITGDSDLMGSKIRTKTYLGRPWGKYSQVVFMESSMSEIIEPDGWLKWTSGYESTVFYAEYSNNGPGSNVSNRVKWAGVHVIDKNTASKFSVSEFIQGNTFIPLANIPYIGGLQQ